MTGVVASESLLWAIGRPYRILFELAQVLAGSYLLQVHYLAIAPLPITPEGTLSVAVAARGLATVRVTLQRRPE